MTQFIDVSGEAEKKVQYTTFSQFMSNDGWENTSCKVEDYEKVLYLGFCREDGELFVAYRDGFISLFKGTKGDEFNNQ